ncbi:MAG: conjugal transfer protein TraF [Desulfurococcaceae archaeon]
MKKILLGLCFVFVFGFSLLVSYKLSFSWYTYNEPGGKTGWWWYKEYIEVMNNKTASDNRLNNRTKITETKEEKGKEPTFSNEKPKDKADEVKKSFRFRPLSEYKYEELLKLSPQELKEMYEYYLDRAMTMPTEENVRDFLYVVDLIRRKSLMFTHAVKYVIERDPELNLVDFYSVAGPAVIGNRVRYLEYIWNAKNLTHKYGLILFVKKGCPYCEIQYNIIRRAYQGVPLDLKVVDISENPYAAVKFNVDYVPAIYLVYFPNESIHFLSSGVLTAADLMERITFLLEELERKVDIHRYGVPEYYRGTPADPKHAPRRWRGQ